MLPSLLTRHPSTSDRQKAINDTRTVLVAAVVATGAAWRPGITARTYRLSREGHFTDRYSKAVEQLANKKRLEVRPSGIYAHERLMADNARDPPTILRSSMLECDIGQHRRSPGSSGVSSGTLRLHQPDSFRTRSGDAGGLTVTGDGHDRTSLAPDR